MVTQQTADDGSTTFDTQVHSYVPDGTPSSMTNSSRNKTLSTQKLSLMDYATPTANVSAFCRSVLSALIPNEFWGEGDTQTHNKGLFMKIVDRFIKLRRFETVSLHDAVQGMKVCDIARAVDLPQAGHLTGLC
jgi:telomerase reverse transcriptase